MNEHEARELIPGRGVMYNEHYGEVKALDQKRFEVQWPNGKRVWYDYTDTGVLQPCLVRPGLVWIDITDPVYGSGGDRITGAKKYIEPLESILRAVFDALGMPLHPGRWDVKCRGNSRVGRRDRELGQDVLIHPIGHDGKTMQVKCLHKIQWTTATVEWLNSWRKDEPVKGNFYNMRVNYHFVAHIANKKWVRDWVMLDWPKVRWDESIKWKMRPNYKDGCQAAMLFEYFDKFLPDHITAIGSDHVHPSVKNTDKHMSQLKGQEWTI